MSEDTHAAPALLDDKTVQELISTLSKSKSTQVQAVMVLVGQVSAMGQHLEAAEAELRTMRRELHALRLEGQQTGQAEQAVNMLDKNLVTLRDCYAVVKHDFLDGCKKALAAIKDKGVAALDSLTGFFHIRGGLDAMRTALDKNIAFDDKAIASIEAKSTQYHEAGRHLANAARTVAGKAAIPEAKPVGKLAKGLEAPYKADRACNVKIKRSVEKALGSLDKLEQAAEQARARSAQCQPTIEQRLGALQAQIAQAPVKDAPVREAQHSAR